MPGYEGMYEGGTRVSVPGYDDMSAGVRGYQCRSTMVLVPWFRMNTYYVYKPATAATTTTSMSSFFPRIMVVPTVRPAV